MSVDLDEHARQRALDAYRAVDSLPEEAYDDIVRLASMLCDVPIALVSLIDRDRQWFKATLGLELRETHRDVAFCDHAIRAPQQLLEVPDTHQDPRFAGNPLVTGPSAFRFYAGMPLVTPSGAAIGTVCVLDQKPRQLTDQQRAALSSLARLTMNLLDNRHRIRELELAALLAHATPEPAPAVALPEACRATVAVFEVQGLAGAATRIGERALERMLHQFEHELEARLVKARGDCASRSSGSAEVIVVLHANDIDDSWRALDEAVREFEGRSGLRVASAFATATTPDESLTAVFMRADESLSERKSEIRLTA